MRHDITSKMGGVCGVIKREAEGASQMQWSYENPSRNPRAACAKRHAKLS